MAKNKKKGLFTGPGITFGGAAVGSAKPAEPKPPAPKPAQGKPTYWTGTAPKTNPKAGTGPKVEVRDNSTNARVWQDTTGAKTPRTTTVVNGKPLSGPKQSGGKKPTSGPKTSPYFAARDNAPVYGPPEPKSTPQASRAVANASSSGGGAGKGATGKNPPRRTASVSGGSSNSGGGSSYSSNSGSSSPSYSGGSSSSSSSSAPASPSPKKQKPVGAAYRELRSAYKDEQANQPKSYETPEARQERMGKSSFDWGMSADQVKSARKEFLKSHPAAAKAVAKGTLSMGDINLMMRRLSKKNAAAAPTE